MSEKKDIEKLFKDALGKSGARPPEGSKEEIRKKLVESGLLKDDNSPKRIFLWIIGIASIAIMSVTAVYFMNDKNKNLTQAITSSEQHDGAAAIGESEENKDGKQTDSSPLNGADIQKNSGSTGNELHSNSKHDADAPGSFNSDKKNLSGISEKQGAKTSLNKKANNSIGHSEQSGKVREGEGEKVGEGESGKVREGNQNDRQDGRIQNQEAGAGIAASDITSVAADTSTGIESGLKQNELAANATESNADSAKTDEKKKELPPDSVSKETTKKGLSIDVFAGPQLSNFKYEGGSESYQALTSELEISETEKTSFHAGIGVNIPLKSFFVVPGVNYSQLKSDFSYSKTQMNIDSSHSKIIYFESLYYLYDSLGNVIDSIGFLDSTLVTIHDTSYSKIPFNASNKISVFEIPLWIGYKFSTGKFDIELKAGASVSFITSINTTMLPANSEEVVVYDDRKNSPYRKNYFSILAAANFVYNINDKFSIFLQPALKYGLGSVFKSDYPVSKKIQSYPLGIGLRVKF